MILWILFDRGAEPRPCHLAAAYASAELTPVALIEAALRRDRARDHPNVWIHLAPKAEVIVLKPKRLGAFSRARPRVGSPFGVKDNIDVAGMPTTAACPDFAYLPTRSALTVERLLAAGGLCLGKTNMDQFATGLVGTRSPYGACRNVFNPSYLAGGSSSGSAVAVAGGHVSFALGTDTAGSGACRGRARQHRRREADAGTLVDRRRSCPRARRPMCVSVFAAWCVSDGALTRERMLGRPSAPPSPARSSRAYASRWPIGSRSTSAIRRVVPLHDRGHGAARARR